jgi:hypothetical protein
MEPTPDPPRACWRNSTFARRTGSRSLWNRAGDSLSVHVFDARLGESLSFAIAAKDALDAFVYAAFRRALPPAVPAEVDRELSLH